MVSMRAGPHRATVHRTVAFRMIRFPDFNLINKKDHPYWVAFLFGGAEGIDLIWVALRRAVARGASARRI